MQNTARSVGHFVEFVDAADAVVGQNESAGLQDELARFRVLGDVRRQTDGRATLAGRVLRPGHQMEDVLQQLRLAGAGIAAQQDVDLGAEGSASDLDEIFLGAAEQLQQDALLDVLVFVDGRRDGSSQALVDVRLARQFVQDGHPFGQEARLLAALHFVAQPVHVDLAKVDDVNVRTVDGFDVALDRIDAQRHGSVDAGDCDTVARLNLVYQIVVCEYDDRVRSVSGRHVV